MVQRETLANSNYMQISRWDLGRFWHSETSNITHCLFRSRSEMIIANSVIL